MNYFHTLPDGRIDRLGRWNAKWRDDYNGKPGFHLPGANPNLKKYHGTPAFDPPRGEPILVPLCGKTLDLAWLRDEAGHRAVVGVEGVPQAIRELREESLRELREVRVHGGSTSTSNDDYLTVWTTAGDGKETDEKGRLVVPKGEVDSGTISVICADFFDLSSSIFALATGGSGTERRQPFGSVFDRGALVAVPPESRPQYVSKLDSLLTPGGQILLVTLDRDSGEGPPFKTDPQIVKDLFLPLGYDVALIEEHAHDVKGKQSKEFVLVATKKE